MEQTDMSIFNNDGNNPWDNNPWGQRPNQKPTGGGNRPPQQDDDLEQVIRKSQEALKNFFANKNGGKGGGGSGNGVTGSPFNFRFILFALGILFLLWLASGFYIIDEGSRGLVMRLGKYERTTTPGPNYHLPYPIETVEKVAVDRIRTEEIGYRGNSSGHTPVDSVLEESLMLTGDENIVDVKLDVQWIIKDARDYIFNVRDTYGENTVKDAAESAIRDVIGDMEYTTAIAGEGRAEIASNMQKILQKTLDEYHMGVQVNSIQIRPIDPPSQVLDAFRDVQTARADKEKAINQAQAYRNDIIPRAKGDAAKAVQEAEAYKQEVINKAQGDASRFKAVYAKYLKGKTVTRERMYLETAEDMLKGADKIIVDGKAGAGVLPYLPLKELKKTNAQ